MFWLLANAIQLQANPPAGAFRVSIDAAEADAVLAILELRVQGRTPVEADWNRLFATAGYRRLKRRETAMKRPFENAAFKTFVLGDDLLQRAPALRKALAEWRTIDLGASAQRALDYLPAGARIQATIYPVIKPRDNSFVFELDKDPAIFVFLNPERSAAQEGNVLAHEFHHIGYGTLKPLHSDVGLAEPVLQAQKWTGAFGEGFAMLAAAGGPGVHPHATSPAADRARWDQDMAKFPDDFDRLASFFQRVLDGSLKGDAAAAEAATYYGIQGPWYTVGWRMACLIELRLGRARLLRMFQDLPTLYRTWNEAAEVEEKATGLKLPRWPEALTRAIEGGP